jgi:N-acetylneuraminate synthase
VKATIIAEVGLAHDGSFATALSYIDACKAAGADIVKFQFHMPSEGTADEPFRAKTPTDPTRAHYWKRTGFGHEQWRELRLACELHGMGFMTSVFSEDAVLWAGSFGQNRWKVPSGQVVNIPMLDLIAQREEPVYISTGLATPDELRRALDLFDSSKVTLLHCVTEYPTTPPEWRLVQIERLAKQYWLPVGLSDHSGCVVSAFAAAARYPVAAIEVHVTLSKYLRLPDTPVSLTMDDLKHLVAGVRMLEEARETRAMDFFRWEEARERYMPTLVAKQQIPKGTKVQLTHLIYRKQGQGPGMDWEKVVGRTLVRDIQEGERFAAEDFEGVCAPSAS